MFFLTPNKAATVAVGPFVDSVDGDTEETGLTINQAACLLSKNGGALAAKNASGGATHDANGNYFVSLDAADTDTVGRLRLFIHAVGALPVWEDYMVSWTEQESIIRNTSTR